MWTGPEGRWRGGFRACNDFQGKRREDRQQSAKEVLRELIDKLMGGGEGSKEYCKPLWWDEVSFTLTQPKSFAHYLTKMLHCVVMSSVLILSFFVIDCIRSVSQDCLLPVIQIIRFTE